MYWRPRILPLNILLPLFRCIAQIAKRCWIMHWDWILRFYSYISQLSVLPQHSVFKHYGERSIDRGKRSQTESPATQSMRHVPVQRCLWVFYICCLCAPTISHCTNPWTKTRANGIEFATGSETISYPANQTAVNKSPYDVQYTGNNERLMVTVVYSQKSQ